MIGDEDIQVSGNTTPSPSPDPAPAPPREPEVDPTVDLYRRIGQEARDQKAGQEQEQLRLSLVAASQRKAKEYNDTQRQAAAAGVDRRHVVGEELLLQLLAGVRDRRVG